MHKAIFALNRKDGIAHEEFQRHWQEEHASIACDLPKLSRYTLAFPIQPEDADYDGVAELYYDDEADLQESLNSEVFMDVMEDVPNFADPNETLQILAEEHVQLEEK